MREQQGETKSRGCTECDELKCDELRLMIYSRIKKERTNGDYFELDRK